MFNEEKHTERKNEVAKAWERIKIFLQQIYGGGGNVNVKFCSSWCPGVNPYIKNGQRRLFSKQVAIENIAGRPVDMQLADTVAVPANPGATHKTKMYSKKEYSESQLVDGLCKFDDFVSDPEEGGLLLADTNTFLFKNTARASLERLLRCGFKILCITWNYEGVLLVHPTKKICIWLHLPLCKGALGQPRPIKSIVLRNMTIQSSTMMVAWCLGEDRGQMNDSFHYATLAAYAYEHAMIGCHMYAMHGAACQRDVLTDDDVFPLLQNDLSRARGSGIDHPIAKNTGVSFYVQAISKMVGKTKCIF
jgi:hypothetical protein